MPDGLKWTGAVMLLAAAVGAFYMYADQSLLLRVVGLLVAVGVASFVALQTEQGNVAWGFIRESRNEVRRVVWPNRKETVQTTMIVIAMVALVAVILWMFDALLGYLVRLLLGQGG